MQEVTKVFIQSQIREIKEILPELLKNIQTHNEDNKPLNTTIESEMIEFESKLFDLYNELQGYYYDH